LKCRPSRAVIFRSECLGTLDHILLSEIRDFPFLRLLRLAGLRWRYSTPPPHGRHFFFWQTPRVLLLPSADHEHLIQGFSCNSFFLYALSRKFAWAFS
jgi:hypothetical protein